MYKLIQRLEGRYHDLFSGNWSTYASAKECVHWQRKIEAEQIIDSDKVQLACVPAEKVQEFLTNPAASVMSIPANELPLLEPSWAYYAGMAIALGIATMLLFFLAKFLIWIFARDWSK